MNSGYSGSDGVINILSSGNVGIGTTSPSDLLHLENLLGNVVQKLYSESNKNTTIKLLEHGDGDVGTYLKYDGSTNRFGIWIGKNPPVERFTILRDSGNVGIGTTTPGEKLVVDGRINATTDVCITGGSCLSDASSQWTTTGSDIYYNDGNVGIGTATPQNTLNVIGDANFTGTINSLSIISNDSWIYLSGDGSIEEGLDISIPESAGRDFYYGYGGGENHYFGQVSNLIIHSNGNLITTGTGDFENLIANGYTKLGSDAPAIKMKKLTGTTALTEGGYTNIAHGLTGSKIVGVQSVEVEISSNSYIPDEFTRISGYQFHWQRDSTNIGIFNHDTNSEYILNKSVVILVTYEE
jgi:hypothetical protein